MGYHFLLPQLLEAAYGHGSLPLAPLPEPAAECPVLDLLSSHPWTLVLLPAVCGDTLDDVISQDLLLHRVSEPLLQHKFT